MYLEAAQNTDTSLQITYCFFCMLSTIFESIAVLLTVRNLIAMSLLNEEDIKIYVRKSTWVLTLPLKLNTYAVICVMIALVVISFDLIDYRYVVGFSGIFLAPSAVLYLTASTYSAKYVLDLKDDNAQVVLPVKDDNTMAKIHPTRD